MDTVDRGFLVQGRVQGVGFRWWTRQTASALGVVGSVQNLPDGSVHVAARADEATLRRFADNLRKGPALARVKDVREIPVELPDEISAFTIEHG